MEMKDNRNIFQRIADEFKKFGHAVAKGDIFTKLTLLIMGAQQIRCGQVVQGILKTILEVLAILYVVFFGLPYTAKLNTLGTVKRESTLNLKTMKNEVNNYDHSFKILLFGIICIVVILVFLYKWFQNVQKAYELEMMRKNGKKIPGISDQLRDVVDKKFHKTLLFLPCLGVATFIIIPLIVMICVAFTNYDKGHLPPTELFTWVGLTNFKSLFTNSVSLTFGYSFRKVLVWTLVWAVFATFTTYIAGILLALLINGKRTKWKKMWRTFFVIAIAVPQFVTLLLVRNFFGDSGIVNTLCANAGITSFLKNIGLLGKGMTYIPFLTDPHWTKAMIILINIWIGAPYLMLIATGILMNIPSDLLEAAKIDGANRFQIFRKITMPYMLAVTGPYLVTQFVANINNFNVIYLLTDNVYITKDQLLANSSAKEIDLLVTWLFRLTQEQYNYKMASVIGIMVFVICAIFTLVAFTRVNKNNEEAFK